MMKIKSFSILIIPSITCLLAFSACNSKKNAETGTSTNSDSTAVITFTEVEHDFGTITQGEKVSHAFKFKNTGSTDLLIISAQGSCGCTVPSYPREPIVPGKEANVDVVFDSDGKSGKVEKTVTLLTNCVPNTNVLTIHASIIASKENESK
jgi:Protein of unknown function (DUF1573)